MDGKTLTNQFLDEADQAGLDPFRINQRSIYDALDKSAIEFVRMTSCLNSEVTITTVADQQEYNLPPDFIRPYVKTKSRRLYVKYVSGDVKRWPVISTYERILRADKTDAQAYPYRVCLRDISTPHTVITGSATADGAASAGEANLQDSSANFLTVNPRDIVHNLTKKSDGIVTSAVDTNNVKTALFQGLGRSWLTSDNYVINPTSHKTLFLDAPSENDGDEIIIPYKAMPRPVYTDYATWRISELSLFGIVCGAVYRFCAARKGLRAKPEHRKEFLKEVRSKRGEIALSILQGNLYSTRL